MKVDDKDMSDDSSLPIEPIWMRAAWKATCVPIVYFLDVLIQVGRLRGGADPARCVLVLCCAFSLIIGSGAERYIRILAGPLLRGGTMSDERIIGDELYSSDLI